MTEYTKLQIGGGLAGVIFILLLVAPWVPPHAAGFLSVGIFLLATVVYVAVKFLSDLTYQTADRILPEIPEEERNEHHEAYLRGEIDEVELEERIEEEMNS